MYSPASFTAWGPCVQPLVKPSEYIKGELVSTEALDLCDVGWLNKV